MLTGGGSEIEFALTTEPGGERHNSFRLKTEGAAEALAEVIGACAAPTAPEPAPEPAAQPAPAPAPAAESPPAVAPRSGQPIGPGTIKDNSWQFLSAADRTIFYRTDWTGKSLTFECAHTYVSVTLGVPVADLFSAGRSATRADLALGQDGDLTIEEVSKIERDGIAFFRIRGAGALDFVKSIAARNVSALVAISDDPLLLHDSRFDSSSVAGGLTRLLSACGEEPAAPPSSGSAAPPSAAAASPHSIFDIDLGNVTVEGQWVFEPATASEHAYAAVVSKQDRLAFFCEEGTPLVSFSQPKSKIRSDGPTTLSFNPDYTNGGFVEGLSPYDLGERSVFYVMAQGLEEWVEYGARSSREITIGITPDGQRPIFYTLPARGSTAALRAFAEACR